MGAFVSQAILLASLHVIFGEEASQFIFDLEETVKRYADNYAKRHKTTVQFYDITATREELKQRPVYKRSGRMFYTPKLLR
uniref:Putative secreted protein n=1 Tax=Ixodes ricinus TaxID=34613 RepID=A0A6B0UDI4_IXORI